MKKQILNHKGYEGEYWFDPDDRMFQGSIRIGKAGIVYQGETYEELVSDFQAAINDYVADLKAAKLTKTSGTVMGRISPTLHAKALKIAAANATSLNALIKEGLEVVIKKYEKKAA